MKILVLSALYPPKMLGGAEDCARNFAEWAARQGHEVAVIRATDENEPEGAEAAAPGVTVHRVKTAHIYAPFQFPSAAAWKKPIWHVQDHIDGGIAAKVGRVIDAFAPDAVVIHFLQGLGYRALAAIGERNVPVTFVLHDLGLACIRMNMFKGGQDCTGQCQPCKVSSRFKLAQVRAAGRIRFVSPSQANIDTLARFFPIAEFPHTVILNPNAYPEATVPYRKSATLRLLYAGRLQDTKGVAQLAAAVAEVAKTHDVTLTLAGKGPEEETLRAQYGNEPWFDVLGFIPQQTLANVMMESDLLCIPSIWAENSPGVVVQALALGLPVMGSDRGGIPELVRDGHNGRLVRGQGAALWRDAIAKVASGEEPLAQWRANALAAAGDFTQDALGRKVLAWIEAGMDSRAPAPATA